MKEISEKFCKGHHIIYLLIFIISCTAEKDNNLGMIIDDAYINLPLKGQMISVGYFKLSNNSSETKVVNKIFCQDLNASLHTSHLNSEGMLTMKPIKDILIERNSAIIFQPSSHHVMISGLKSSLKLGSILECNLIIDKTKELTVAFALK